MLRVNRIVVELVDIQKTPYGQQSAWLCIRIFGLLPPPGLLVHRVALFQHEGGERTIAMPRVPGDWTGSAHTAVTFDSADDRRRVTDAVLEALADVYPELGREARS
jgi:hypothetical protein